MADQDRSIPLLTPKYFFELGAQAARDKADPDSHNLPRSDALLDWQSGYKHEQSKCAPMARRRVDARHEVAA